MNDSLSRKQFFRQAFVKSARFSADLLNALQSATETRPTPNEHAFEADLPPELLAAEAQRLGIDPENKAAVLAAIAARLETPQK